jgi:hypothetical protein
LANRNIKPTPRTANQSREGLAFRDAGTGGNLCINSLSASDWEDRVGLKSKPMLLFTSNYVSEKRTNFGVGMDEELPYLPPSWNSTLTNETPAGKKSSGDKFIFRDRHKMATDNNRHLPDSKIAV